MVGGARFDIPNMYTQVYYRKTDYKGPNCDHELLFITRETFGTCVWKASMTHTQYGSLRLKENEKTYLMAIFDSHYEGIEAVHYIQNYKF